MKIKAGENSEKGIGAIVIAAGESRRMRCPKQLLAVGGRSLLRHTIEQVVASVCAPIVVVLGANAARIEADLKELPDAARAVILIVRNEDWAAGMGASIGVGVRALIENQPAVVAACILVCDQPFVSTAHINDLAKVFGQTEKTIIASRYQERAGVPALFARKHFAALSQLAGDCGARDLIAEHAGEVSPIPFSDGDIDLDTPEDYERFLKRGDKRLLRNDE